METADSARFSESGSSDEALIQRLREGDRDAADALTRRWWPAIHRFCANYLEDEALGEDVTQETFAKLIDGTELPAGAFKPWLYKVARNRCLDIHRRHQRSPTHNRPIRTGFDIGQSTAGPRTRMARSERQAMIQQIIAAMPDDYREVLMLKYQEDFSRQEIAETLGLSEQAVKGRIARAGEELRQRLRDITGSIS